MTPKMVQKPAGLLLPSQAQRAQTGKMQGDWLSPLCFQKVSHLIGSRAKRAGPPPRCEVATSDLRSHLLTCSLELSLQLSLTVLVDYQF